MLTGITFSHVNGAKNLVLYYVVKMAFITMFFFIFGIFFSKIYIM